MRAVLLFLTAAGLCASQQLSRDGAYWVEQVTGTVPAALTSQLRVLTRGPVTLRGGPGASIGYTLNKRVRARSEREARRLLSQVAMRQAGVRGAATLTLVTPPDPLVATDLQIRTPQKLRHVSIYTDAGDVRASGLDAVVEAESGGGCIYMTGIAGNATARTGGGEIRLGSMGGSVRCMSAGGSIYAERVGRESWFETAGGEIYVRESGGAVHALTSGGNIQIGRVDAAVWARTGAGRIEVQSARGIVTAGNSGGSIQIGSAYGVRCESTGGSIRLQLAELVRGTPLADSTLSTAAGDITVLIPSNLALTVRALNESGRQARIVSDFSEIRMRPGDAVLHAEGLLNGGGPVLNISASSGTIYLRRQR